MKQISDPPTAGTLRNALSVFGYGYRSTDRLADRARWMQAKVVRRYQHAAGTFRQVSISLGVAQSRLKRRNIR